MSAQDFAAIAGGIAAIFVAVSAVSAFLQYRSATRTRRAEWLLALFERFFEKDLYRDVRRAGENVDDAERWNDYLNFFELISYFEEQGHLTRSDITVMFDYWLRELDHPEVRQSLQEQGFEKLDRYLGTMEWVS